MKIESISIQNFKRFDNLPPISFKHKTLQEVSDQFLILGDNGSGKTTILQAIALPLSLATKKIQKVSDFNWIGFLASRYWRWGIPHIELEISFVDEEISATKEVAEIWYNSLPEYFKERRKFVEPGDNKILKVVLDGEDWQVGNREEDRLQFLGRNYVQKTLKKTPVLIDELDLNLHPPLAQFFVNQLPKLSPTSQFIFTTHSEAVTEIIGNDEIYRLKGGRLCL